MSYSIKYPINILFVHANNEDIGGADYCQYKLVTQLNKKKFNPIVCLSLKTSIYHLYIKNNIKIYTIDMERIKKDFNIKYLFRLIHMFPHTIIRLLKIIRDENIDLIQGNDLLDVYGPIAGKLSGTKTIQYIRLILTTPPIFKQLITFIVYIINDKIITVSESVASLMFSTHKYMRPKAVTCYDWVDFKTVGHDEVHLGLIEEFNLNPKTLLIGVIGRIEPWKGQKVFIKAAAIVKHIFPGTVFFVVGGSVKGRGRDKYQRNLFSLAQDLSIEDSVIFTGHRRDIKNIMESLDIIVHTSIEPDPLPGVVLEAMYCSKPVIAVNAGGVREEIINGTTGVLYTANDHNALAESIIFLIKNPTLAKKMGKEAQIRVNKVFDKNNLIHRIESIYESTIKVNYSN